MIKNYSGDLLSKPALIAKTVRKAVTKRRPRTRYLVGFGAKPMVWTHRLFGDRVFDWVLRTFSCCGKALAARTVFRYDRGQKEGFA